MVNEQIAKYKEAIDTLDVAIAEVEWNYPMGYAVAFETSKEAINYRIPKIGKHLLPYSYSEDGWVMECPNCKTNHPEEAHDLYKFCFNCGQALDWEN